MQHLGEYALYAVGLFLFAWIVMSASGSIPALFLWRSKLRPVSDEQARQCLANVLSRGIVDLLWAADHGFEAAGAYVVTNLGGLLKVVAWARADESTYLCVYLFGERRSELDFVSVRGDSVLTTGTTKDAHLFPSRSGSWLQSFSVSSAGELWTHHEEALAHLRAVAGFRPADGPLDLQEEFVRAMRRESRHIRSYTLWPLRTPYWYFTRRRSRHGKSVRELMES